MTGDDELRALRVLDSGFLKLDSDTKKASVREFMTAFHQIPDDNQAYRDLILSTNFSLFGSDQQIYADTYNMFYLVKDKKVATQPLKYKEFFEHMKQETGMPGDYAAYEDIMNRHVLTCKKGEPCRNGRLIQIFIDPSVLNDIGYFSVLLGAPVLKNDVAPNLSEPIEKLRTEPLKFHEYLADTKGGHLQRAQPHQLRHSTLELHDLQVRLFMRPEAMFDRRLIEVKSYWRFDPPSLRYYSEIKKLENKNLGVWQALGAPLSKDVIASETISDKLKPLVDAIFAGATGSPTPVAAPLTLEEKFFAHLINARYEEAAKMLDNEAENLRTKTFTVGGGRSGTPVQRINLQQLLERVKNLDVLKIAFDKGIFSGGDLAFAIVSKLGDVDLYEFFLQKLSSYKNAEKSAGFFIKYLSPTRGYEILESISAIDKINNDEQLILQALPLIKLLNFRKPSNVLEVTAAISPDKTEAIVAKTVAVLSYLEKLPYLDFDPLQLGKIVNVVVKMEEAGFSDEELQQTYRIARELFPHDLDLRHKIFQQLSRDNKDQFLSMQNDVQTSLATWPAMRPADSKSDQEWFAKVLTKIETTDTFVQHCPSKWRLRMVLEPHLRYLFKSRVKENKYSFEFTDRGNTWRASNITLLSWEYDIGAVLEYLPELKLTYNTKSSIDNWCYAQFNAQGQNVFNIHLNKLPTGPLDRQK
jgi:hypothetical protein